MKKALFIGSSLSSILFVLFYFFIYPKFMILSGYAAKNMCSCVFVGNIDKKKVTEEDLNFDMLGLASASVDYDKHTVTASVFGLNTKTAYYNDFTGCTLVNKIDSKDIYNFKGDWEIPRYDSLENWFNYIDTIEYLSSNQLDNLDKVLHSAFVEKDSFSHNKNTRAALVLYKGQLVSEQYATGFNKDSRLLGWSMTKSLIASMLSILSQEKNIDLTQPTRIEAWKNDDRKNITWNDLLHMNSGLRWEENYAEVSDAVLMLFNSDGIGEYATQMPIAYLPNEKWVYSSGTSNIIATALHSYFNSTDEYVRYPYEKLFYKIGAYSMIMETDAKGRFVGSSYSWATARDWARIGQLYLQDGNWAGEQILSKSWVGFVQQRAENSDGIYGGHFWLNKGNRYPDVPADMYNLEGFQGQNVFIIPSKKLVIVRLGLTYNSDDFDFNNWLSKIIESVE
jgi:CubicO group peptidase (beta-lactamase class C family)